MEKRKQYSYIIVSPRQRAGGPIALHALCHYLAEQGYDAKIFYTDEWKYSNDNRIAYWRHWIQYCIRDAIKVLRVFFHGSQAYINNPQYAGYAYAPIRDCKRKYTPIIGKDTIVIYPEKMFGNPLHAKNVVRWLLYYDRFPKQHDIAYGNNDLFVCYRLAMNSIELNPNEYVLETPFFDMDLYKRTNFAERHGDCYILRKGKSRKDIPQHFDGPIIDDLPETLKVEVFNQCQRCISYDTQTSYSAIAALCGCQSIVVPELGKGRSDYRTDSDWECGVAFGFSEAEIDYAKSTVDLLPESFESCHSKAREDVRTFVSICELHFAN